MDSQNWWDTERLAPKTGGRWDVEIPATPLRKGGSSHGDIPPIIMTLIMFSLKQTCSA